jgi:hypothetical protein
MQAALVTCLFNPNNSEVRYRNYDRFFESVAKTDFRLYCVEMLFEGQVPRCSAHHKIELRGDSRHILWQKEALLNLGINAALQDGCDPIAWVDADVILPTGWEELAVQFLRQCDTNAIVQIAKQIDSHFSDATATSLSSVTELLKAPLKYLGHPGGGWLARAEFWDKHPLFDFCIIGGGDWANFCGYATRMDFQFSDSYRRWADRHPMLAEPWREWEASLPQCLKLDALPCSVMLLSHGTLQNRQYGERTKYIADLSRDDLRKTASGIWEWTGRNFDLQARVAQYFNNRNEDQ